MYSLLEEGREVTLKFNFDAWVQHTPPNPSQEGNGFESYEYSSHKLG